MHMRGTQGRSLSHYTLRLMYCNKWYRSVRLMIFSLLRDEYTCEHITFLFFFLLLLLYLVSSIVVPLIIPQYILVFCLLGCGRACFVFLFCLRFGRLRLAVCLAISLSKIITYFNTVHSVSLMFYSHIIRQRAERWWLFYIPAASLPFLVRFQAHTCNTCKNSASSLSCNASWNWWHEPRSKR